MYGTTSKSAWALVAVIVCLTPSAQAQELRRDSVWNGVVTGAAVGAGLGLVVAKTTEDICSAPDCAYLLAFAGGVLGRLVDGARGNSAPVVPGQWIDDSRWNGALIGAGVSSAVTVINLARRCGTGPGRVQCTAGLTANDVVMSALWGAALGALVDVAIPKRAPGGAAAMPGTSRRLSLTFNVRF